MVVLGMDLGSTSTKYVVMDENQILYNKIKCLNSQIFQV